MLPINYSPTLFTADGYQLVVMPMMTNETSEAMKRDRAEAEPTTTEQAEPVAETQAEPSEAEAEAEKAQAVAEAEAVRSPSSGIPREGERKVGRKSSFTAPKRRPDFNSRASHAVK